MAEFFASGRVADLVLLCLAAETLALWLYRRRTGRGPALPDLLALAVPGAFLALALRAALTESGSHWVALALVAAFVAHLADLFRRWPR